MNKEEKALISNIFLLTGLPEEDLDKYLNEKSFSDAKNELYLNLRNQAHHFPIPLIKKYCDYCLDENDTLEKMINDLKIFSSKIELMISIDEISCMIKYSDKVKYIIKKYIGIGKKNISLQNIVALPALADTFVETYCDMYEINIVYDIDKNDPMAKDGISTYIQSIPKKILTKEEEIDLFKEYKETGDIEIRNKLVEHNLRWVLSLSSKFVGQGSDKDDLVQVGNEGLIRAVEKFDVTKGYRLSTYAAWWIRQAMTREIDNNSRTIRLPVHVVEKVNSYKKTYKILLMTLGRIPTDEEMMEKLECSRKEYDKLKCLLDDAISLDTPVGEEDHGEQTTLADFVEQSSFPLPESEIINKDSIEKVDEVLENTKRVSARALEIIKFRTGFYNGRVYTLEEIGQMLGVTRERVRQIEAKAYHSLFYDKNLRETAKSMGIKVPPINRTLREEIIDQQSRKRKERK